MLYLIGLGLNKKAISLKGLETAQKCDKLFLENYTSVIPDLSVKELESRFKNKVKILDRSKVEEGPEVILNEAENQNIGFLVLGDPLVATTHISLKLEAEKRGIEVEVIHAASIYSAIGELGLQVYKIGKSVTIPMDYETGVPYETLKQNKKRGLHTLLFLDLNPKNEKFLRVPKAIEFLLEKEKERGEGVFLSNTKVLGAARIGSKPTVYYGSAEEIKKQDFGAPPYILVVPGKLHFMEKEALERFSISQ